MIEFFSLSCFNCFIAVVNVNKKIVHKQIITYIK